MKTMQAESSAAGLRRLVAGDLMTPSVLTVGLDMPIAEAAAFLVDNEITGAVVEDRAGKLVGVLSVVDIAMAAALGSDEPVPYDPDFFGRKWDERLDPDAVTELVRTWNPDEDRVADIMSPEVFTVQEDTPVPAVARQMLDAHVHRLLVLRGEEPVGILSTSDLVGLLVEEAP